MKIKFSNLSTKELATLAQRVINSSESGKYTIVENHELLLEIKKQYADYDKVYNKLSFSGKGPEVAIADEIRDKNFRNMKDFLKAYSKMSSLPKHKEAGELYKVFKETGLNIDRLNYAEQTAQMNKLINDLSCSENQEKITELNLSEAYNELKTGQAKFEKLYAEQAEANAELRSLPSASSIRGHLQSALRNYFNLLSAMKNVPGWEMIYADIHELVKKAGGRKPTNTDTTEIK